MKLRETVRLINTCLRLFGERPFLAPIDDPNYLREAKERLEEIREKIESWNDGEWVDNGLPRRCRLCGTRTRYYLKRESWPTIICPQCCKTIELFLQLVREFSSFVR